MCIHAHAIELFAETDDALASLGAELIKCIKRLFMRALVCAAAAA
jgi:hypothetical protein